ncbi:MAG: DUF6325 family protein [Actinomycetes bacterium]
MSLGPVEYALFAFEGNRFTGDIVPALTELVDAGTVRIIDLAFILKESDGSVLTLELDDLPADAAEAFSSLEHEVDDLLNADDLLIEAEALPPGTSAALVVWENLWAKRLADAVRASGGALMDHGRVDPELAEAAMALYLGADER